MECEKCHQIPKTNYTDIDLCILVPTVHHLKPLSSLFEEKGLIYRLEDGVFILKSVDLKNILSHIESINLSQLEQSDIKLMPLEHFDSPSFKDLKHFQPLKYWNDLYLSSDLLYVLNNNSLKIMFHPIVDAKSMKIYGYEALSRGVREDGSIIRPDHMFSMAKSTDLLFFLDRLCREQIIKRAFELNIGKRIFINFIPTSIYDPEKCLQSTDNAISKYKLDPRQIVFEVVETEYIEDYDHLSYILNYYRQKGYSTALDDIGSGYATTDGLLALKTDYMKIDMELIRGIHNNPVNQEIVSNYISIARKNGIYSLAEGIETSDEYKYLLELGVDFMQGYYFGKPSEIPVIKIDLGD